MEHSHANPENEARGSELPSTNNDDGGGVEENGDGLSSVDLEVSEATSVVEIAPGLGALYGEVPEGIDLIDLGFLPSSESNHLGEVLGALGSMSTLGGNLVNYASTFKGVFRLDDTSFKLLQDGATMAGKEGGSLGAIFQNGKTVRQGRFFRLSMSPAALAAAVGPSLQMLGLQLQLSEISGIVQENIQLTSQVMKQIRHAQWAELEGVADSIQHAVDQAKRVNGVPESLWDSISSSQETVRTQLKLYSRNVREHTRQLKRLDGVQRRKYIENNGEAITFDASALLRSIQAYAQFQALRALRASDLRDTDPKEAKLFDDIVQAAPQEIAQHRRDLGEVADDLARELYIISALPGRATMPITKKRRNKRFIQQTSGQLLKVIEPVARALKSPAEPLALPAIVCAPAQVEMAPYLDILRWYMSEGEALRALAFPYVPSKADQRLPVPVLVLQKRVEASWDALTASRLKAVGSAVAGASLVAVTDKRVLVSSAYGLLRHGRIEDEIPLDQVRFVRPPESHDADRPTTIGIESERDSTDWHFPSGAEHAVVDALVEVIDGGRRALEQAAKRRAEIEGASEQARVDSEDNGS